MQESNMNDNDLPEDPLEEVDESKLVFADEDDTLDWDRTQQGRMADLADQEPPNTEEA